MTSPLDMASVNGVLMDKDLDSKSRIRSDGNIIYLLDGVLKWAGLPQRDGAIVTVKFKKPKPATAEKSLSNLNDARFHFPRDIAKLIEKQLVQSSWD